MDRRAIRCHWRCAFPNAQAIEAFRSPLAAFADEHPVPDALREVWDAVAAEVIGPLKSAADDVAWADAVDVALPRWLELRLEFTERLLEDREIDWRPLVEEGARLAASVPLTLLPEPDAGAARYAVDMLFATSTLTLAALDAGRPLNVGLLDSLLVDIAIIELAWLTLIGRRRPIPAVASAAAWEAYSRVRPMRSLLAQVGLDETGLPREDSEEAIARARASLARVARGWSDDERRAVESARLPAGDLQ